MVTSANSRRAPPRCSSYIDENDDRSTSRPYSIAVLSLCALLVGVIAAGGDARRDEAERADARGQGAAAAKSYGSRDEEGAPLIAKRPSRVYWRWWCNSAVSACRVTRLAAAPSRARSAARALRRLVFQSRQDGCAPPSTRRAVRSVSSSVATASRRSSSVAPASL